MKNFLLKILPRNRHLYSFCKSYVERHDGDCNGDMMTNGELRTIEHFLPRCTVVFDVGAHTGEWANLALTINPNLTVHCFEPCRESFEKLTARPPSDRVILNNFGLSSARGEKPLFIYPDAPGLNSLYQRRGLEEGWGLGSAGQTETIKLDTLEHYCSERGIPQVDFLKVDVEGHEMEVFKGGARLFQENRIQVVQFEYGGCNIDSRVLLKDIFEFFEGTAYRFYKIMPDTLRPVERYDQRLENFKYQNWLIVQMKSAFWNPLQAFVSSKIPQP